MFLGQPRVQLNTGIWMPQAAVGTGIDRASPHGMPIGEMVTTALEAGYLHIDTAEVYPGFNKIGQVLSKYDRTSFFLTSKVDVTLRKRRRRCTTNGEGCFVVVQTATHSILRTLGVTYVDLLLLHRPPALTRSHSSRSINSTEAATIQCTQIQEQWRALESALHAGQARAIGVSNYCFTCLQCLLERAKVVPSVLQQMHRVGMGDNPFGLIQWARNRGIVYMAYSVLGGADGAFRKIASQPAVIQVARAHGVSAAEVVIRWVGQQGIPFVVLSNTHRHLASNLGLAGPMEKARWSLTTDEVAQLSALRSPAGRPSYWGECDDSEAVPSNGSHPVAIDRVDGHEPRRAM